MIMIHAIQLLRVVYPFFFTHSPLVYGYICHTIYVNHAHHTVSFTSVTHRDNPFQVLIWPYAYVRAKIAQHGEGQSRLKSVLANEENQPTLLFTRLLRVHTPSVNSSISIPLKSDLLMPLIFFFYELSVPWIYRAHSQGN